MRWKNAVFVSLALGVLFLLLLVIWLITACFKSTVPSGLVKSSVIKEVGSNMLLSPQERLAAMKDMEQEVKEGISSCTKLLGKKLFYKNIGFEHHNASKCPTVWFRNQADFKKHLCYAVVYSPLIDIYADDNSSDFFSDEVFCTYNPVTHRIIGLKYPKGLNIGGEYEEYGNRTEFNNVLENRCL